MLQYPEMAEEHPVLKAEQGKSTICVVALTVAVWLWLGLVGGVGGVGERYGSHMLSAGHGTKYEKLWQEAFIS